MAAGMIAERRMIGSIDQIDGVVYFKSKFEEAITAAPTIIKFAVVQIFC